MLGQFDRFKDAPWFPQEGESVFIGGSGGIGSWLAFLLTRANFKVYLQDFDLIETHNTGGQMFKHNSIGEYKVDAVANIVKEFSGDLISTSISAIGELTTPSHIFTFAAFDNMEARKQLFNIWKKSILGSMVTPIFIDGRLEPEQLQIFCVTPENMEEYEREHLFDDNLVPELSCTFKQTSHTAAMIASHMVGFFTNHITNIYQREKLRLVPKYFEYFIPINLTETYE